jgi:Amt family ammonium transporter
LKLVIAEAPRHLNGATYTRAAMSASTNVSALEARIEALEASGAYNESLDTIWMLLATMLVFFMHAGFSLLEAGSVRFKNTQNILAKNLFVVTAGFLCWYVFGYAFAFGAVEDPNKFIGGTGFFTNDLPKKQFRFWLFQGAFCATGATIVSGSMAERTQLKGFAIYTILMTSLIYPVVVYWGWSGSGMLNYSEGDSTKSIVGPALIDFAGSGLVHLTGGIGAICGALIVGPRNGRWDPDNAAEFDGHSVPFCVLGTFFLWFGWYGFNPGSTLELHTDEAANLAGLVAVNTTLAPCAAGLLVFALRALVLPPRLLDVGGFCNGILAGLVSITAGCGVVEPWESIIIGFVGGLVYQGASMLMKRLTIDDVVDAFAVHGACGLWGIIACGFFGNPDKGGNGAFYGGDQMGIQLFAALMIMLWVTAVSVVIFMPLRLLKMLRMCDEFQDKGADVMEHSPPKAYAEKPISDKTVV